MDLFQRNDELKEKIDKFRPFDGELLKQIRGYYRIGLTWSSNALEGKALNLIVFFTIRPESLSRNSCRISTIPTARPH